MIARACVLSMAAVIGAGCGAQVLRNVPQPAVVHDGAVWIVETNVKTSSANRSGFGNYNTAVIVCVRDAVPACVRVTPEDVTAEQFRGWVPQRPVSAPNVSP